MFQMQCKSLADLATQSWQKNRKLLQLIQNFVRNKQEEPRGTYKKKERATFIQNEEMKTDVLPKKQVDFTN